MSKKYIIIKEKEESALCGEKCYRIKACKSFNDVKKGDIGGLVQSEKNLSQHGNCWIYDNAMVLDDARVSGNAKVKDSAYIKGSANIFGNAVIEQHATVRQNARVSGYAKVTEMAGVYDNANIYDNAIIYGGRVMENAEVGGNVKCYGCSEIYGQAKVLGNVTICDHVHIYGCAYINATELTIKGNSMIYDEATLKGKGIICGNTRIRDNVGIDGNVYIKNSHISMYAKIYGKFICENGSISFNGDYFVVPSHKNGFGVICIHKVLDEPAKNKRGYREEKLNIVEATYDDVISYTRDEASKLFNGCTTSDATESYDTLLKLGERLILKLYK